MLVLHNFPCENCTGYVIINEPIPTLLYFSDWVTGSKNNSRSLLPLELLVPTKQEWRIGKRIMGPHWEPGNRHITIAEMFAMNLNKQGVKRKVLNNGVLNTLLLSSLNNSSFLKPKNKEICSKTVSKKKPWYVMFPKKRKIKEPLNYLINHEYKKTTRRIVLIRG